MSNFEQDDLILKEAFQKGYQNIKLPKDLKQTTLSEMMKNMQQEQAQAPHKEEASGPSPINVSDRAAVSGNKEANKNAKKTGKKVLRLGAGAAALCAAALAFLVLRPSGVSYITPMEEGIYYDTVELKNGEIHFVKNRVAISITPNAGHVVIGAESPEEDDSREFAVLEETVAESGGLLVFQETDQVSLPEITEDNWSNIGEQMIYVTVLKSEEVRYQAVFEMNGTAYQVIGTDVTQKEFIDYLYNKILG